MTSPDRSPINIRKAVDKDRSAIAGIHARSWQDAYRQVLPDEFLDTRVHDNRLEKWLAQEILPQDLVLLAEDGGTGDLLGFIAVWCRPDPFIDNLHVLPGLRSRGTGTRLMQAAARELLRHGHTTAWLWAVKANTRAIRFYERLGGICIGQTIQEVVGVSVPTVKIEWPDLGRILVLGS